MSDSSPFLSPILSQNLAARESFVVDHKTGGARFIFPETLLKIHHLIPNLTELCLEHVFYMRLDILREYLSKLGNLRKLYLGGCQIGNIPATIFPSTLTSLSLHGVSLTPLFDQEGWKNFRLVSLQVST